MENTAELMNEDQGITMDEMSKLHDALMSKNENEESACFIRIALEQLHNLDPEHPELLKEEDHEMLCEENLEHVTVDLYTKDLFGRKWSVCLTFENDLSPEKADLMKMLEKYQELGELKVAEAEVGADTPFPMFSILFVPYELDGDYFARFVFPEEVNIVEQPDNQVSVVMLFDFDNMDYVKNTLSEDDKTELRADILTEMDKENLMNSTTRKLFS